MRKVRKNPSPLRHFLLLLAIPLTLMSTGYALFSQQLTVNANANKPAYSSSQDLLLTYDTTVTSVTARRWQFNLTFTVSNNGTSDVDSWHATFDIPSNYTQFSCTDATCVNTSGAVVVDNAGSNGTILAGQSTTFTMKFRLTVDHYTLDNVTISGTYPPVYQTMAGLSASYTVGSRVKHQGVFYWPYTFTVTNNTGQAISGWRIQTAWDSTDNAVWPGTTDTTINYFEETSQLSILSTTGIANNGSFQFVITLGSASNKFWTLGSHSIQGAP